MPSEKPVDHAKVLRALSSEATLTGPQTTFHLRVAEACDAAAAHLESLETKPAAAPAHAKPLTPTPVVPPPVHPATKP